MHWRLVIALTLRLCTHTVHTHKEEKNSNANERTSNSFEMLQNSEIFMNDEWAQIVECSIERQRESFIRNYFTVLVNLLLK
jgi:hypothetical protein